MFFSFFFLQLDIINDPFQKLSVSSSRLFLHGSSVFFLLESNISIFDTFDILIESKYNPFSTADVRYLIINASSFSIKTKEKDKTYIVNCWAIPVTICQPEQTIFIPYASSASFKFTLEKGNFFNNTCFLLSNQTNSSTKVRTTIKGDATVSIYSTSSLEYPPMPRDVFKSNSRRGVVPAGLLTQINGSSSTLSIAFSRNAQIDQSYVNSSNNCAFFPIYYCDRTKLCKFTDPSPLKKYKSKCVYSWFIEEYFLMTFFGVLLVTAEIVAITFLCCFGKNKPNFKKRKNLQSRVMDNELLH